MIIKIEIQPNILQDILPNTKGENDKTANNQPLNNESLKQELKKNMLVNNLGKFLQQANTSLNSLLNIQQGFQTSGNSIYGQLSSNANVSLNFNTQGFSLGLNQNLQITVGFLFQGLPPGLQKKFGDFTSQQIVSAIFVSSSVNVILKNGNNLPNLGNGNNFPNLPNGNNLPHIINGQNFPEHHSVLRQIFNFIQQQNPNDNPVELIKNLWEASQNFIKDCACAKTVGDLEIIAQKFTENLSDKELETLFKLTEFVQRGQTQAENVGEKLNNLLVQLIAFGEKEAVKIAGNANDLFNQNFKTSDKTFNSNLGFGVQDSVSNTKQDKNEKSAFYSEKTENTLRQRLDFYPHYVYDRQISSFENSVDESIAKDDFVKNYYTEIEDWLASGRHRLVKDFHFDKPLGMIVERNESGFITADKIRVVLVRDGSIEGWHFLRSFLIS